MTEVNRPTFWPVRRHDTRLTTSNIFYFIFQYMTDLNVGGYGLLSLVRYVQYTIY